jgi:large subunit ribosomal protein L17
MAAALIERERIITTPAKAKAVRPFIERLITLARRALPLKDTGNPSDRARYLHYYRVALSRLQDKKMVQKLFGEGPWREENESLAARFAERPGGYTRIVKLGGSRMGIPMGGSVGSIAKLSYTLAGQERVVRMVGNRLGDNAEQVIFELVGRMGADATEDVEPQIAVDEAEPTAEVEQEVAPSDDDVAEDAVVEEDGDAPTEDAEPADEVVDEEPETKADA